MATPAPDGISDIHLHPRRGYAGHANPLPLLILVAVLAAGLLGLLGGQPDPVRISRNAAAEIAVRAPATLRNGMFFEMTVDVTPRRPVKDLTIAVSGALWHEMTINTTMPSADKEEFKDGAFRFSFGEVKAGETRRFKIDGQVNPPMFLGTHGEVAAFDGETRLVSVPIRIKVRP